MDEASRFLTVRKVKLCCSNRPLLSFFGCRVCAVEIMSVVSRLRRPNRKHTIMTPLPVIYSIKLLNKIKYMRKHSLFFFSLTHVPFIYMERGLWPVLHSAFRNVLAPQWLNVSTADMKVFSDIPEWWANSQGIWFILSCSRCACGVWLVKLSLLVVLVEKKKASVWN